MATVRLHGPIYDAIGTKRSLPAGTQVIVSYDVSAISNDAGLWINRSIACELDADGELLDPESGTTGIDVQDPNDAHIRPQKFSIRLTVDVKPTPVVVHVGLLVPESDGSYLIGRNTASMSTGTPVVKGDPGLSAYEVAVTNGFDGTPAEWLESLRGVVQAVTSTDGSITVDDTDPNAPDLSATYSRYGHGSPEGLVTAPAGTLYTDLDGTGGAWQWVKTTGSGATGWVATFDTTFVDNVLDSIASAVTLDSIAGTPAADVDTRGVSVPVPLQPESPATMYVLFRVSAEPNGYSEIAGIWDTSVRLLLYTGSNRNTSNYFRDDGVSKFATVNDGYQDGVGVAALTVDAGVTTLTAQVLGISTATQSLSENARWGDSPKFKIGSGSNVTALRGLVYLAVHTAYQRDMIMRKLLKMSEAQ